MAEQERDNLKTSEEVPSADAAQRLTEQNKETTSPQEVESVEGLRTKISELEAAVGELQVVMVMLETST